MAIFQRFWGKVFGYGTYDAPYTRLALRWLAWRAPRRNWLGVWDFGQPRPWVNKWDPRLVSDEEFREIIRQTRNAPPQHINCRCASVDLPTAP